MYDISQFDLKKTLALIKGSLFDHATTAQDYRQQDPPWVQTLLNLTLPVVVTAVVLGVILAAVFGSMSIYRVGGVGMFLMTLAWSVIGVFIFAFVAALLAGVFGGVNNFNRGFALASLVSVVGYAGSVLGTLPWLGWLISLAVAIYALVLFYRDVPVFLAVPDNKRVVHFIVTIVVVLVVNFVLSMAIGGGSLADRMAAERMGQERSETGSERSLPDSGVLGLVGQQVASAMQDSYEPPEDGEISNAQMRRMIGFLEEARETQRKLAAELEAIADQEKGSVGDVLAGMNKAADLSTTEMKVVKEGGGNWAEHQWVKQQLAMARSKQARGQDGGHNYDLYLEYEDELSELMFLQ